MMEIDKVQEESMHAHKKAKSKGRLPVTLLAGFLGAGKTTLLKHILESKHGQDESFKCAVVVNDMAELNIDKDLVDKSAVVQSDEVVAMQNGCVCCTLQSDLVEQVTELAKKNTFDYMIIEASGVSEPAHIAKLFEECEDDHDHSTAHKESEVLADFARMDTLVTVVDVGEIHANLASVSLGSEGQNLPLLTAEQIEFANVIVMNKCDLVSEKQLQDVKAKIEVLNSKADILTCKKCLIDVMQVVNTKKFNAEDFEFDKLEDLKEEEVKACCKASMSRGESACCLRARTLDSGKSQVLIKSKNLPTTRHQSRFGINSLVYKARRPFDPMRFHNDFVNKFFMYMEMNREKETQVDEEKAAHEIEQRQKVGMEKKALRTETFGDLLRSKGFVWLASRHDLVDNFNHAGNVSTMEMSGNWNVLHPQAWMGTEEEKAKIQKDWVQPYGDRRQELVFIGQDLKAKAIQDALDECLLSDEDFALGIDYWKGKFGDVFLDGEDSEEEEEEGEQDGEMEEDQEE